jgi:hypothetical protein
MGGEDYDRRSSNDDSFNRGYDWNNDIEVSKRVKERVSEGDPFGILFFL